MIRFFKIAQVILYCAGSFEGYFEISSFKYFGYSSGLSTYVRKGSQFFIVVFAIALEVILLFLLTSIDFVENFFRILVIGHNVFCWVTESVVNNVVCSGRFSVNAILYIVGIFNNCDV
jgi:hypothetical protein